MPSGPGSLSRGIFRSVVGTCSGPSKLANCVRLKACVAPMLKVWRTQDREKMARDQV